MFQCDAVDTSPDLGGQMSSNPSKWLFNIIGGRQERDERDFLSLGSFSLTFKNIFLALLPGGDSSHRPHIRRWAALRVTGVQPYAEFSSWRRRRRSYNCRVLMRVAEERFVSAEKPNNKLKSSWVNSECRTFVPSNPDI